MATTGTLAKVTVWLGGRQLASSARVEVGETDITIFSGKKELSSWTIVETVKELMAWDVDRDGSRVRLVAQAGCGCGGMRRFTPDAEYSGALV